MGESALHVHGGHLHEGLLSNAEGHLGHPLLGDTVRVALADVALFSFTEVIIPLLQIF